jgi:hypothetical protein
MYIDLGVLYANREKRRLFKDVKNSKRELFQ